MRIRPLLALALCALALSACIALAVGDVQAFRLFFTLDQALAAGERTEAASNVFPHQVKIRRNWVKIFGRLEPPAGGDLPASIEVEVVLAELDTQQVYYTFRQEVPLAADGSFAKVKRFLRHVKAGTLETVFVRPLGGAVPQSTEVAVCIEVTKKKADLSPDGSCAPGGSGGGGDVKEVRVLDNLFEPQSVIIQAGDTVRWVREGSAPDHTVTEAGNLWDSGFSLQTQGATFERLFTAADDDQTFLYYCRTHQGCCQMQGSVRVGNSPPPPPDYE